MIYHQIWIALSRGDFVSVIEQSLIMSMPHFWNNLYYHYRKMIQNMIVDYLKNRNQ